MKAAFFYEWSGWRDLLGASLRLALSGFAASRLHSKFAPGEFVNSQVRSNSPPTHKKSRFKQNESGLFL